MARSDDLYKDKPSLERDDKGKVTVTRKITDTTGGKGVSKNDESAAGEMGTRDRHASKRREMHHRHIMEHHALHHSHENEEAMTKGDKGAMHDRQEGEIRDMAKRHLAETKAMHDQQEQEPETGGPGTDASAGEGP